MANRYTAGHIAHGRRRPRAGICCSPVPPRVLACRAECCLTSRKSAVRARHRPPQKALQIGLPGDGAKYPRQQGNKQGKSKWIGRDCQRAVARGLRRPASPATIGRVTPLASPTRMRVASPAWVLGAGPLRRGPSLERGLRCGPSTGAGDSEFVSPCRGPPDRAGLGDEKDRGLGPVFQNIGAFQRRTSSVRAV